MTQSRPIYTFILATKIQQKPPFPLREGRPFCVLGSSRWSTASPAGSFFRVSTTRMGRNRVDMTYSSYSKIISINTTRMGRKGKYTQTYWHLSAQHDDNTPVCLLYSPCVAGLHFFTYASPPLGAYLWCRPTVRCFLPGAWGSPPFCYLSILLYAGFSQS